MAAAGWELCFRDLTTNSLNSIGKKDELGVKVRPRAEMTTKKCQGKALRLGGYIVRDWTVGRKSVPSAKIQLTVAYPNTAGPYPLLFFQLNTFTLSRLSQNPLKFPH